MKTTLTEIGYLIILVIPVIVYFLSKFRVKHYSLFIVFTIPYIAGALELLGFLSVNSLHLIIELLIVYLFLSKVLKAEQKTILINLKYILVFIAVIFISFILNEVSFLQMLLFIRIYIIPILFLWYITNKDFGYENYRKFNNYLFALLLSQIPVAIGKFVIIGAEERYMGTMSIFGGSLTAMFSLIGISIFYSMYLFKRRMLYLVAIVGFLFFSIVGEKRAIVFFAPLLIIFISIYYNKKKSLGFRFISAISTFLVVLVIGYLAVRFNPTLNPENKLGGSFDIEYLGDYTQNYLFPDKTIRGATYYGRGEGPLAVYMLLTKPDNLMHLLIGFGPGDLVTSQFIKLDNYEIRRGEDLITQKHDIGYGGRTGILWTILQIGILGVSAILLFYISLFRIILRSYSQSDSLNNSLILATIGMFFIWGLDFATYSRTMLNNYAVVIPFLWFTSQVIKGRKSFY